jgi:mannosyltransferase OCH1-like enzyme
MKHNVVTDTHLFARPYPKDVERSDFFRYLIVLHTGGVYADIDTECRKPLDRFLRASDTLVVGWENEFRTDEMAYSRQG